MRLSSRRKARKSVTSTVGSASAGAVDFTARAKELLEAERNVTVNYLVRLFNAEIMLIMLTSK